MFIWFNICIEKKSTHFNPLYTGTFTNSKDTDEMPHNKTDLQAKNAIFF